MAAIKTAVQNGVVNIELSRIKKKNAFDNDMYTQIYETLKSAQKDNTIRAALIYGQTDFFSVGNDLEDFLHYDLTNKDSSARQFMRAVGHFKKPLIAAASGPAIGIGAALLLHCDMVYASDTAHFIFPNVSLGLVPDFGVTYILPRVIGKKAYEKLLLAQPITAQEALDWGMIAGVLPATEVLNHARAVAERFNKLPPAAVRATKRLLQVNTKQEVDVTIEAEAASFAACAEGPEVKEAIKAFLEKRWPDYSKF